MATALVEHQSPTISTALAALEDRELTVEDRAAAYAVIHQVQLRLNRALRTVKEELVVYLTQNNLRSLGPLSVEATPFDVEYPCNDEGNWADATIQDAMAVIAKIAPDYVRLVPQHYEIRTAELGKGVAGGDPVARQLHQELKDRHWRTEGGRRLTLTVKEAR